MTGLPFYLEPTVLIFLVSPSGGPSKQCVNAASSTSSCLPCSDICGSSALDKAGVRAPVLYYKCHGIGIQSRHAAQTYYKSKISDIFTQ